MSEANRAGRLTLRDVAAELGVSAKTVSNAYRRPDQLSSRLRQQVLATAARLGYPGPDPLAAGLRRGRVGAIGIVFANSLSYAFEDPVTVELLAGVTSIAEGARHSLLLLSGSTAREAREAALTDAVIDGVIVDSLADDDPLLPIAIARRLPLAVVDQPDPARLAELGRAHSPWVGIDDYAAARSIAEHVLSFGHRRLGVLSFGLHRQPEPGLVAAGDQTAATYSVTRRRLAGYRDTAAHAGVDWGRVPVFQATDSTTAEGSAGARALLSMRPRPTVLLCLSDQLARGALRAAADLGLRVPGDLSIAGFDDAPPAAALGLTTIRQPSREKGRLAASALLAVLAAAPTAPPRTLPTELIARGSTGPPPRISSR